MFPPAYRFKIQGTFAIFIFIFNRDIIAAFAVVVTATALGIHSHPRKLRLFLDKHVETHFIATGVQCNLKKAYENVDNTPIRYTFFFLAFTFRLSARLPKQEAMK